MSEADALVLDRSLRMSEPESALEQGWLLAEMESRLGCSAEELARRFDRGRTWVANRLALVETLPESVQQLLREGHVASSLAMRYLAPVARINREHCRRMAAAFAEQVWTARQAGAFYRAWRDASGAVRERILAAPKLFAKTQAQVDTLDRQLSQISVHATGAGASGLATTEPRRRAAEDPTRHRTADRTPTTHPGTGNKPC